MSSDQAEEHRMLQEMVAKFVDNELMPLEPAVMARLAKGESVDPSEYFFRTLIRFQAGAPAWLHLNKVMAIASGRREARLVVLDYYRIT